MYDNYELIIGLEVHIQSNTQSKMFCSCSAKYFNAPPNSHVCPVCFGLPGALSVPNKKAIDLCVKTSLALNCKINNDTKFDRKNYFYPDLPKGFQISQYDKPIGYDGEIEIELKSGKKKIGITRVHQEEDTGKSIHENGETYLDFNKSGVPLIEVVSEADFRTKEEVSVYCKRLRQIVRYLEVSNADMEKGEMRFELNMSVRKQGEKELPKYKVEVKNIASISVLEKVIDFELKRQVELLEEGQTPKQETRGLVDMSGKTVSQRSKEDEADYRYFPEPDIPLIEISQEYIKEIKDQIGELPQEKKERYVRELSIDPDTAEIIISDLESYRSFESLITDTPNELVKEVSKWYTGDYFSLSKKDAPHDDFDINSINYLVKLINEKKITRANAKEALVVSYSTGQSVDEIIKSNGYEVVTDTSMIENTILKVLGANPKAVEDAKKNPNATMFLVGQVMKELKGQADASYIKETIFKHLKS